MSRIRKINTKEKHYYIVDTNFLVNVFIPVKESMQVKEKKRIESCKDWWRYIKKHVGSGKAKIYIPDLCIAETFKALAKKYYKEKILNIHEYTNCQRRLSRFLKIPSEKLRKRDRKIDVHDISTNRDIIISVDRFFEIFFKNNINVQIVDLIILAIAKYLIDFYDFDANECSIISLDERLEKGAKYLRDIPYIYNPTRQRNTAASVFM